ncbi:MAG: metallophosphoesterase [Actinomycetota bacterium]
MRGRALAAAVAAVVLVAAFTSAPERRVPRARAGARAPVIAAVGDIACKDPPKQNRQVCRYDDVAATIERGDYDALLELGDIQYEYGRYRDFVENYDVYFRDLLPITYPVPGNHDYGVAGAAGYFRYFGDAARSTKGYYSFDLGAWHIIGLNSQLCPSPYKNYDVEVCAPGDAQYDWLARDLAANDAVCTLAYFHHPRISWIKWQNADWNDEGELRMDPMWDLLYANGADVVLTGHEHLYQRFYPLDGDMEVDRQRGMVQFIAGQGGESLQPGGHWNHRPTSLAASWDQGYGFLQMKLRAQSYDWRYVPAESQPVFIDEGSRACH